MTGYEHIKNLAKERGCNTPDLLVLASQNDPYYVGSPSQSRMGRWFAALWDDFGYTTGIHLRRVHYQLISQREPTDANGGPYENTEKCWKDLCGAGKFARHLGLIDPSAFVDRRNPSPHVYMVPGWSEPPGWWYDFAEWRLPKIEVELGSSPGWEMPDLFTSGYEYDDSLQPYHLEVWCEKSTMNDVLIPLCEWHAVNLVTGVGYMSITSVVELLGRVRRLEKPCRILYISDHDPAGSHMPTGVARQIEFGIAEHAPGVDIRLSPVILTPGQVEEYDLPRTPIKDTDRRKEGWESRHGEGAVELDALEALHPGELARIVERRVREFRDRGLRRKVRETEHKAREQLEEAWVEQAGHHEEELREIRESVAEVVGGYRERIENLDDEMQAELEPYQERLDSLRRGIQADLGVFDPDLPPMPEPETPPERDGWLFDSGRDYMDQLHAYKDQNGSA